MSSLYNPNNFEQLEIEITKIAYRQKVNVPLTQYTLYSELLSVYDLKTLIQRMT